jgi:hypothetical protein
MKDEKAAGREMMKAAPSPIPPLSLSQGWAYLSDLVTTSSSFIPHPSSLKRCA